MGAVFKQDRGGWNKIMIIENLEYIDGEGNREFYGVDHYVATGNPVTVPSFGLRKSMTLDLRWVNCLPDGGRHTVNLQRGKVDNAVLSADRRFIVVDFCDPQWPRPWSAGVFNSDGTLRGVIGSPGVVLDQQGNGYLVEGFQGIGLVHGNEFWYSDDIPIGMILFDCYCNYGGIVKVGFDPSCMQWGRVLHSGGRA